MTLTHSQRRSLTLEQRRAIAKEIRRASKFALKALERAKAISAAAKLCTCGKRYAGHKRGPACPARKGGESWVKVYSSKPAVLSTKEKCDRRRR